MYDNMKDKVVLKNCPFTEEQVIQVLKDIRDHPEEYKKLVELKKEMIKEWREELDHIKETTE